MKSEIRNFLKTIGKNQKWLAESIGVSDAQISQYLKGTYGGNVQSLEEKLKSFMANYSVNSDDSTNGVFIKTRNTEAVGYILTKSIQKRSLSAIFGNAGFGKDSVKNFL
jgi:DNA transposition AAA+ family ATPase